MKESSIVIENDDDIIKSHRISKIAVSPKGTYVVTYSEDDESIIGWNVDKDVKKEAHLSKVKNNFSQMKVSDNKIVICQYNRHVRIYKLGVMKPIKKFKYKGGTLIDFTRNEENEKLVYCQPKKNKILIYSINKDRLELELDSVYKIHVHSGVLKECGITEEEIWARTSHYLYFWNLKKLKKSFHSLCFLNAKDHQPERYYSFVNDDVNSSIDLNINKDLILIGDNEQKVIFSKKFDNTPIRYIKNKNFRGSNFLNDNYFLVHSTENDSKKVLLYNIFDETQPVDVTKCFKIYDYNLQTNKVYGVDDNNNIILEDFGDHNWEEYFLYGKDHDHNNKKVTTDDFKSNHEDSTLFGWNNYFNDVDINDAREKDFKFNDFDINDTIINPDMEKIRDLLNNNGVEINDNIIDLNKEVQNSLDNSDITTRINFRNSHNNLYGWKITMNFKPLEDLKKGTRVIIQDSNGKCICFKDIPDDYYEPMKCTLLKNNALALILKKKVTEKKEENDDVDDDYDDDDDDDDDDDNYDYNENDEKDKDDFKSDKNDDCDNESNKDEKDNNINDKNDNDNKKNKKKRKILIKKK